MVKTILEVHLFGAMKPASHPLITIIREWPQVDFDFANNKMTSDLFIISVRGAA